MTHALNYGTACFEGIRGYYNKEKDQMYILKLKEHYERLIASAAILFIPIKYSIPELCNFTVKMVKANNYKTDVYIRPLAYKSEEKIGLGLNNVASDLTIFCAPFGNYLDISKGIKVATSTWKRIDDLSIPARAKVTGGYINSSLAKAEAQLNGFDEAIMLSHDGHVSEGSGENIFVIRKGKIFTPQFSDNILEGITRDIIILLAEKELGLEIIERPIDRSELYVADEIFLCGTGAQISPVVNVDHRKIGNGKIGPISQKLQEIYFKAVKGQNPKYSNWLTPAY